MGHPRRSKFAACAALGPKPVALMPGYALFASSSPLSTGGLSWAEWIRIWSALAP